MKVMQSIPPQDIADLIVTAIEGGSNYWCNDFILKSPNRKTLKESPWYSDAKLYESPFEIAVTWEDGKKTITQVDMKKGMQIFAEKYPRHFGDFRAENYDATTADVFLQCVVLGDVVYG